MNGASGGSGHGRVEPALAILLVLVQAVLILGIARDKSDTVDEPVYLFRSAPLLDQFPGRIPRPWLAPQWAFAAALKIADPRGDRGREDLTPDLSILARKQADWPRLLFAARSTTLLATLAAGLWIWRTGRRFGAGCGLAAHAIWVFSPSVLAHGGLANVDAWGAAWAALLLLCVVRFVERPLAGRAAPVGVALALIASTKATAALVVPAALAVMAWAVLRRARSGERRVALRVAGALALSGFVALWAIYGFSVGDVRGGVLAPFGLGRPVRVGPLPFPAFWETVLTQSTYAAQGKNSYLFGEVRSTGWWWFYLAVLAFKTTLGAQALFLARLVGLARAASAKDRAVDLALLGGMLLPLFVLSLGQAQGGVRYLVPAFPAACVFLARGLPELGRRFGARGSRAFALALGLGAFESLSVHPHSLMFFNRWAGGPAGGPRYLIHGDDWGQDKLRLVRWQRNNEVPVLYYTRFGPLPNVWGLAWEQVPCEPRKGVFALHAEEVHRHGVTQAGCLDWLTLEPPDERLGYSIYLYVVDKRRLERLAATCGTPRPFWRSGREAPCDRF